MIYFQYILFACSILLAEVLRKKRLPFDYLTMFNAFFALGYIVVPVLLYHYSIPGLYQNRLDEIFLLSVLAYLCMMAGWGLGVGGKYRSFEMRRASVLKFVSRFSVFIILIAAVYIIGKGGLVSLLVNGALVRYGYEDVVESPVDLLKHVYSSAEIIVYILFSMFLSVRYKYYHKKIRLYYLAVLSLYAIFLLSVSSRGAIANLLIMHLLIFWYFRGVLLKWVVNLMPVLLLLVIYGKQTFFAIATSIKGESIVDAFMSLNEIRQTAGNDELPLHKFVTEYSHTVDSLVAAISRSDAVGYTYFSDFLLASLRIIPQKVMRSVIELPSTISAVNTEILTGDKIAAIPPGLVAHCYYSQGVLGIIVGFFLYGFLGRRISNKLLNATENDGIYFPIYAYTALLFGFFVTNGDPNVYFYSVLWPTFVYFALVRFKTKKRTHASGISAQIH